eukprot:9017289-Alexandrium_andersonii.AAC.1
MELHLPRPLARDSLPGGIFVFCAALPIRTPEGGGESQLRPPAVMGNLFGEGRRGLLVRLLGKRKPADLLLKLQCALFRFIELSLEGLEVGWGGARSPQQAGPVSYTHLTLPTICSV